MNVEEKFIQGVDKYFREVVDGKMDIDRFMLLLNLLYNKWIKNVKNN